LSTATEEVTESLTHQFYEDWLPSVVRIAAREHHSSTLFARDDIEQAIWEHVVKNWKHYVAIDDPKYVEIYMTKAARGYVRQERVDFMYFAGAFIYTPKIVAGFLETCAWQPLEEVPDIDARVDLIEAFASLRKSSPKQAAAVFKRYGMGEDGLSSAERMNVSLGTEALCHRLNSGLRLSAESIDLAISKES
jgi:DNA-directed RNA polymerase specialized sigma24 family protein